MFVLAGVYFSVDVAAYPVPGGLGAGMQTSGCMWSTWKIVAFPYFS